MIAWEFAGLRLLSGLMFSSRGGFEPGTRDRLHAGTRKTIGSVLALMARGCVVDKGPQALSPGKLTCIMILC